MRYPSIRWLFALLALTTAGRCGLPALHAQDRAAAPRPGLSAANASTPIHHWWDAPPKPPKTPAMPASAVRQTSANAVADKTFRLKRDKPGDSKPLILDADDIASWTEKNGTAEYFVFLLRGTVLAQQGIVQARFRKGVVWVNVTRYKDTGKWHTEVYAEGGVRLENGSTIKEYPRLVLDLTTRGEFKVRAHRSPLLKQTMANDDTVKRGRAEGLGPAALRLVHRRHDPSFTTVQPASREVPSSFFPQHLQETTPATKQQPLLDLIPVAPTRRPASPPAATPSPTTPATKNPQTPTPGVSAAPAYVERIAFYAPPDDPVAPPPSQGPAPGVPMALPGAGPQPPIPESPATSSPIAPDGSVPPSGPTRVPPGTPPVPPPSRPLPPPPKKVIPLTRNFHIAPRQGSTFRAMTYPGPNGETAYVITGGVILQVRNAPGMGMVDMEADRVVIWTKGNSQQLASNIQQPSGYNSNDLEVYLSGHIIIRQAPIFNPKKEERTISANEAYYDVSRNVAIALDARMQMKQHLMNDPVIAQAKEIRQTSANTFEVEKSEVFSSKLTSDPGLKVILRDGVIEDRTVPLRTIFGTPVLDRTTGQPVLQRETMLTGNNNFFTLEKIPFFWLPHVSDNLQEPLGPVQDFNFGYNRIFGVQFGVSLNAYDILGLQPRPQTRWLFNVDYLSYRGPVLGTDYNTMGTDLFGMPAKYSSTTRALGMIDRNYDILGGPRPMNDFNPTNFRGWLLNRTIVEKMPYGFSFLGQLSPVSDRNFIEQYFKRAWDLDPNYDTFAFLQQQQDNWQWSFLVEPRLRRWVTMTENLPRADGWLIGQDFFKTLTFSTHLNAQYSELQTSTDNLPQVSVTDVPTKTFRGSWMQETQLPIPLGPFKIIPYGRSELTTYSNDIYGNAVGRAWGAAGVRASIPFSHLFPNIQSELWNVNGINHKVVASLNYVDSSTNMPYTDLPQLDRLNTDAANQSLRDIRNYEFLFNPNAVFDNHGLSLVNSPYYNTPQTMAIRRLLWDRIDTLGTMEQLQMDVRQRWQTKRGFPGYQHVVDWMTLDLSASYFPAHNRDNFGHYWSFLKYNYLWNVGDRTAVTSTGWTDPFPGGVRLWTVGGYFNRPDRTNFYLGFRYIDPLMVRAATAAITYVFSPKYAATVSSTYDFGTGESFSNSLMFTRMGSDLQVSLGVSYNALQQNFNVLFNIVPNLLPANRAFGPMGAQGAGKQVLK